MIDTVPPETITLGKGLKQKVTQLTYHNLGGVHIRILIKEELLGLHPKLIPETGICPHLRPPSRLPKIQIRRISDPTHERQKEFESLSATDLSSNAGQDSSQSLQRRWRVPLTKSPIFL